MPLSDQRFLSAGGPCCTRWWSGDFDPEAPPVGRPSLHRRIPEGPFKLRPFVVGGRSTNDVWTCVVSGPPSCLSSGSLTSPNRPLACVFTVGGLTMSGLGPRLSRLARRTRRLVVIAVVITAAVAAGLLELVGDAASVGFKREPAAHAFEPLDETLLQFALVHDHARCVSGSRTAAAPVVTRFTDGTEPFAAGGELFLADRRLREVVPCQSPPPFALRGRFWTPSLPSSCCCWGR